jgi:hypothetical protein
MQSRVRCLLIALFLLGSLAARPAAEQPLTWRQVRARFVASDPTLLAGRMSIEEARTQEITAALRPNPTFTASADYIHPFTSYGALEDAQPSVSVELPDRADEPWGPRFPWKKSEKID